MFSPLIDSIRRLHHTSDFIPLHVPKFEGNEIAYLNECVHSTYVSSVGPFVEKVETTLAQITGSRYAVACVNGTAALHIALMLADVKPGDLVITQALSFIATSNAISYLNAIPLYVDVDADTMGMSPSKLQEYLSANAVKRDDGCTYDQSTGRRIRACVPMHTFGHPARIDEIADICRAYGIALVEDAAESIGSTYKGRHTGTTGMMGTLSFNGNKTITAGGGGAIVTDDERLARRAKHLTTQAKVPHRWEFIHDEVGYNYRMPNINAALLYAQLEQLEKFIARKRKLAAAYEELFASTGARFMREPADTRSNYWLCAIQLADREARSQFLESSNDAGVMTRPVWKLMHHLPMFAHCPKGILEVSESLEATLVNLPSSAVEI